MNQSYVVGKNVKKSSEGISLPEISKIVLIVDEESAFEAGDDTGYALEVYCPYGTQQMAYDLLGQARGFEYTGYSAKSAQLPPEAELGDGITVGDTYGMLATRKFSFTPKLTEDIGAPLEKEVEHEYSYEGTLTKEVKRKLTLGVSYYGTSITRTRGLEIKHYDAEGNTTTRVTLNSETLAFYNANGNKAFYYDSTSGEFKISSSIVVGLDEYEKKTELSSDIGTYLDTAAGTAKIVAACSATYLTKGAAADQYETITAAAQIAQEVSTVQSKISLSASYGSGTIGSNVRALLQLVSNADTSSIEIKADKINFSGVTTFLRPGDNISKLTNNAGYQTSANVTTIIGNTITTGYIEALNIRVGAAQITGKLTANQIDANNIVATGVTLTGNITATGGRILNLIIDGRLYFGDNRSYYIDANKNDTAYYIKLPGIQVDDATGINCTKGKIGGFTLTGNSMYTNSHSSLYDTRYAGVYIGKDGISLLGSGGSKKMILDVSAASFIFKGTVEATAGSIGAWTINSAYIGTSKSGGSFYLSSASDSSGYWIRAHNAASGGGNRTFSVSKSGYLYATGASISGTIGGSLTDGIVMGDNCKITAYDSGHGISGFKLMRSSSSYIGIGDTSAGNQISIYTGRYVDIDTNDKSSSHTYIRTRYLSFGDSNYVGNPVRNPEGRLYGTWTLNGSSIATTSDRHEKNSIEAIPEIYDALFDRLTPSIYKYNRGTSNRIHTGFIAQDVLEALSMAGIPTEHFAAYVADPKEEGGIRYYLRYEEFVALNTWEIQKLKQRVAQLEAMIGGH